MPNRKRLKQIGMAAVLALVFVGCSARNVEPTIVHQSTQVTMPAIPPPVQVTPVHDGLQITKYPGNYTSFKLETSRGVILVTDPYAMDEDVQADIVTVSHDHADHADFSRLQGSYRLINTAGTFAEKGLDIIGVTGYHNRGETTTKNIIYIFDIDGIRLAQFASQGEMPTDAMFAQIGKVDILIIQIYGRKKSKLSVEEASQIAQRVQARIVIPAHTDTGQTDTLTSLLLAGTTEKITAGTLLVRRADLNAQQAPRVIVLDRPE